MNDNYEVLSPWAMADPRPMNGISPRIADLRGKRMGMFCNSKRSAPLIMTVVEKRLSSLYPDLQISRYEALEEYSTIQMKGGSRTKFEAWLKAVDTVIAAVGD